MLLLMAGTMVEDAGLQPLYAKNADEAVAILEARTDIRIVFTDVDMPGSMDGIKLADPYHRGVRPQGRTAFGTARGNSILREAL